MYDRIDLNIFEYINMPSSKRKQSDSSDNEITVPKVKRRRKFVAVNSLVNMTLEEIYGMLGLRIPKDYVQPQPITTAVEQLKTNDSKEPSKKKCKKSPKKVSESKQTPSVKQVVNNVLDEEKLIDNSSGYYLKTQPILEIMKSLRSEKKTIIKLTQFWNMYKQMIPNSKQRMSKNDFTKWVSRRYVIKNKGNSKIVEVQ